MLHCLQLWNPANEQIFLLAQIGFKSWCLKNAKKRRKKNCLLKIVKLYKAICKAKWIDFD